jgi:hypothetical protein
MRRGWMIGVVLTAIIGAGRTEAQAPTSRAQSPAFRAGVDVVALNVTVTDAAHRFVTDLERDNFLVFEDGRRQQLTFFQQTGLPLAMALLLDSSASMEDKLAVVHEAAIGFARQLGPTDVASVIDSIPGSAFGRISRMMWALSSTPFVRRPQAGRQRSTTRCISH